MSKFWKRLMLRTAMRVQRGGAPPNALTTEAGDPILTEAGDYILTE